MGARFKGTSGEGRRRNRSTIPHYAPISGGQIDSGKPVRKDHDHGYEHAAHENSHSSGKLSEK